MSVRSSQLLQIGSALVLVGVASLGTLAGGCGGARVSTLKEAASADLSCPKRSVHVLTKSGKVREVEACGQRATYQWDEDDWRMIARGVPTGPQPVLMQAPPAYVVQQPPPGLTATSQPTGTPSQPPPSMLPPTQPPPVAPAKPSPGARSL